MIIMILYMILIVHFDENLLYTVIVPIKLIDNIDVLITSFLLSE